MSGWSATLTTKLRPPTASPRHFPRPRLAAVMPLPPSFRVAVVSAPAGSGKTTFLSDWFASVQRAGITAGWLSLDRLDNTPTRFMAHLLAALDGGGSGAFAEAVRLARTSLDAPPDEVVARLIHGLEGDPARVVLVLDDYHEIEDGAVHGAVDLLLRYAPPNLAMVLGTRQAPPLALERLRIRGELIEVGWEDLRFSNDEARQYLRDVCRVPLLEDQIRALSHRSEGWITALQLAAMSVAGAPDADRFLTAFTGAQREMAAYLMADVLEREPLHVREFLMQTSVLDTMTAGLCNAVTCREDSGVLLDRLARRNLFTFALDEGRTWFRYHHLFLEFLRGRLGAAAPGAVEGLHERASNWFERSGDVAQALRHAVASRQRARTVQLLEVAGREQFRQGNFKDLRHGAEALPDDVIRGSPALCVLQGWALAYTGQFTAARDRIASAEATVQATLRAVEGEAPVTPLQAEILVLRAILSTIEDDEPGSAVVSQEVMRVLPAEERALRAFAAIALGYGERTRGDLQVALRRFQEAVELSEPVGSSFINCLARHNVGAVTRLLGRNREANRFLVASIARAEEQLWGRTFGGAILRFALSLVLSDEHRLDEAVGELSQAIDVLEASDCFGFIGMALVERSRNHAALGDADSAAADLARARDVAAAHGVRRVSFQADLLESRLALRRGDLARAAGRLESAAAMVGDRGAGGVLSERQQALTLEEIRLRTADGRASEAVRLASAAISSAAAAGRRRRMIELLTHQALAWSALGDDGRGGDKLRHALELVGDEPILRPFLEAGPGLAPILRALRERREHRAAVDRVLAAVTHVSTRASPSAADERLHVRESQILELIARGLRNREIADRLFLSEETVKWYIKRLFARLAVGSRTQAVATARRMGLLP